MPDKCIAECAIYNVPTKVRCCPYNFYVERAIVIKVVSDKLVHHHLFTARKYLARKNDAN